MSDCKLSHWLNVLISKSAIYWSWPTSLPSWSL